MSDQPGFAGAEGSALVVDRDDRPAGPARMQRMRRWLLVVVVLGVAATLHLTALGADPPTSLSRDFLSDETWWAHNARNHALFGAWRLDDFNQGLSAAPLHTLLERLCFTTGIHLRQIRLVSALAGLSTVMAIGVILRRSVGFRGAWIGMAILATDYFCVEYDRSGFVEPLPAAFMALSLVFVTWPGRRRRWPAWRRSTRSSS